VHPAEVERVIRTNPSVVDVTVFGCVTHPRWGKGAVAAVVVERGSDLDPAAVVETCRAQLASYKKPADVVFVDEILANAGRKVDRNRLREQYYEVRRHS